MSHATYIPSGAHHIWDAQRSERSRRAHSARSTADGCTAGCVALTTHNFHDMLSAVQVAEACSAMDLDFSVEAGCPPHSATDHHHRHQQHQQQQSQQAEAWQQPQARQLRERELNISVATREEVWMIREWAALEGWNPGQHDPDAWMAQ
eukprot:359265-Chlamydomonas_euryale.AAC.3